MTHTSSPRRAACMTFTAALHAFQRAARTRVWNSTGVQPHGIRLCPRPGPTWHRGSGSTARRAGVSRDRLPALADTQVAWLLLSFCAAPRSQYAPRRTRERMQLVMTRLSWLAIRDASGASPSSETPESPALTRARKVWPFLPRMLLFPPAQTPRVPKHVLLARFTAFSRKTGLLCF